MAVVLLTDNHTYTFIQQLETTLLVMLVMVTTALMLLATRKVQEKLGEAGIMVITKIMGLILASLPCKVF